MTARQVHSELADTSPDFRIAVGAASFAEVLRGSKYANELTYAQIWSLVDGAARKGVPDDRELMDLIARAGQLAGQRGPWGSRNVALEE